MVEELDPSELVKHGVLGVIYHVVGHNGRQAVALHGEQPAAEHDAVGAAQKILVVWERVAVPPADCSSEDSLANLLFDHIHRVTQ